MGVASDKFFNIPFPYFHNVFQTNLKFKSLIFILWRHTSLVSFANFIFPICTSIIKIILIIFSDLLETRKSIILMLLLIFFFVKILSSFFFWAWHYRKFVYFKQSSKICSLKLVTHIPLSAMRILIPTSILSLATAIYFYLNCTWVHINSLSTNSAIRCITVISSHFKSFFLSQTHL